MAGAPYKRAFKETGRVCGAYARSTGKPCQCKKLLRGGKCKLHGGQSTGPKTEEGKAKSYAARDAGRDRYFLKRRLALLTE